MKQQYYAKTTLLLLCFLIITGFLTGCSLTTWAQQVTNFKGRLLDAEGRGIGGVRVVILGQGEGTSNDEGFFTVPIQQQVEEIEINLPDNWLLISPRSKRALVPRGNRSVEFEVKKFERDDSELRRQLQAARQQTEKLKQDGLLQQNQLTALKAALEDTVAAWENRHNLVLKELTVTNTLIDRKLGKTDSLVAENTRLKIQIAQLTKQLQQYIEQQQNEYIFQNQETAYAQTFKEFDVYLERLKTTQQALIRVKDAFLNPEAAKNFNQTIAKYNTARDSLIQNQSQRLSQNRLFWKDPVKELLLQSLYKSAIEGIHEQHILPLNQTVMAPMKAAALGEMPRIKASKQASKAAAITYNQLQHPIATLSADIKTVSLQLKPVR